MQRRVLSIQSRRPNAGQRIGLTIPPTVLMRADKVVKWDEQRLLAR